MTWRAPFAKRLFGIALVGVLFAGCSAAEYTTTNARDDLVRLGWSRTEAQCFLDGMRDYYAKQYVDANKRENAARGIPFTGVNPQGSSLYVRNELSNGGALGASEQAAVRSITQRCRG